MRIEVRGRAGLLSDPLRAYAERRLRFAVGRFASRIEKLTVRVEDVNGPRGGVDKECEIVAKLVPWGGLKVEEPFRSDLCRSRYLAARTKDLADPWRSIRAQHC